MDHVTIEIATPDDAAGLSQTAWGDAMERMGVLMGSSTNKELSRHQILVRGFLHSWMVTVTST